MLHDTLLEASVRAHRTVKYGLLAGFASALSRTNIRKSSSDHVNR
jgi:hypothetical protein